MSMKDDIVEELCDRIKRIANERDHYQRMVIEQVHLRMPPPMFLVADAMVPPARTPYISYDPKTTSPEEARLRAEVERLKQENKNLQLANDHLARNEQRLRKDKDQLQDENNNLRSREADFVNMINRQREDTQRLNRTLTNVQKESTRLVLENRDLRDSNCKAYHSIHERNEKINKLEEAIKTGIMDDPEQVKTINNNITTLKAVRYKVANGFRLGSLSVRQIAIVENFLRRMVGRPEVSEF